MTGTSPTSLSIKDPHPVRVCSESCGEMKPLRVMNIHKSVCVTSCYDVLTEAWGNTYADSTLISYVIWSPLSSVYGTLYIRLYFIFFCVCI